MDRQYWTKELDIPVALSCPVHGHWLYPSATSAENNRADFDIVHGLCLAEQLRQLSRQYPAPPAKSRRR
jgi:hypothetical protein